MNVKVGDVLTTRIGAQVRVVEVNGTNFIGVRTQDTEHSVFLNYSWVPGLRKFMMNFAEVNKAVKNTMPFDASQSAAWDIE